MDQSWFIQFSSWVYFICIFIFNLLDGHCLPHLENPPSGHLSHQCYQKGILSWRTLFHDCPRGHVHLHYPYWRSCASKSKEANFIERSQSLSEDMCPSTWQYSAPTVPTYNIKELNTVHLHKVDLNMLAPLHPRHTKSNKKSTKWVESQ